MARVAIPIVVQSPSNGSVVAGATVTVTRTSDGSVPPVYTARTGGGTHGTNALTTDAEGRCTSGGNELFLEQDTYTFVISGANLTARTIIRELVSGEGTNETFPVGGMLFWPGPALPTGYLRCDGSELSRTTYDRLFKAITETQQGTLTNGSINVTGLTSTARMAVGHKVEGTGIPDGATIASIVSATAITLSSPATAGGAQTIRHFPHGRAGSTTFTLPNMKQRTAVGKADSGVASAFGTVSGQATVVLTTNEMPAHGHGVSDPGHAHNVYASDDPNNPDGRCYKTGNLAVGFTASGHVHSANTGISIQNAGGGAAHDNMPPHMVGDWIIRHGVQ